MTISIITPTFNRKNMLAHLFESLLAQQYTEIEWIIVDDGGTDGTGEAVTVLASRAPFQIRYVRKDNGGKSSASNLGLSLASGEIVGVIDDDDYFLPDVFELIARDFAEIRDLEQVAGLSYLTVTSGGAVFGKIFPKDRMISDHIDCRINQGVYGDKCEFTKAAVIRANKFKYCELPAAIGGDTVFWVKLALQYKTCYVNTPVLVKNFLADGITRNRRRKSLSYPAATAEYYRAYLGWRVRPRIRLRYLIAYTALLHFMGCSLTDEPVLQARWNWGIRHLAFLPGAFIGMRWRRMMRT